MADLIGSDEFVAKFQPASEKPEIPDGVEKLAITVDPEGNILGDTSQIEPHILEQLKSPEAQAQIKEMYESYHNPKSKKPRPLRGYLDEPKPEVKFVEPTRRPSGVTRKDYRKMKQKNFKKWTKAAMAAKRSIDHGR